MASSQPPPRFTTYSGSRTRSNGLIDQQMVPALTVAAIAGATLSLTVQYLYKTQSLSLWNPLKEFKLFSGSSSSSSSSSSTPSTLSSTLLQFELNELTVSQLQSLMQSGKYTAVDIVQLYLQRIATVDKGLGINSILAYNPSSALQQAKQLDAERQQGKVRSPMHGIPVLVKDNTSTIDLVTTGGSTALANHLPPRDAHLVKLLRDAGCIIMAKTNLSQWSNFRSTQSISGWSSVGGQCKNPYSTDRNTSGSSSGSGAATAANLGAVSIGTETDGSIVSPANNCCLVGLKPTVGLVSRSGIIPISATQDTAGPMTRSVEDAAYVLSAIAGTDSDDAATSEADQHKTDYTKYLKADGLKGKRIGVVTSLWAPRDNVSQLFTASIELMKSAGATIVDDVKLCGTANESAFGGEETAEYEKYETTVLLYEMKHGLNDWLKHYAPNHPTIKTLEDLIKYNEQNKATEMPTFGQERFHEAQSKGELTDEEYKTAVKECRRMCATEGIDKVMKEHKLDALIAPTGSTAWTIDHFCGDFYGGSAASVPAVAGYPHITVPQGFVNGVLPCGISFIGQKWHEPQLIEVAYAYEQLSKHRKPPQFLRNVRLHE